MENNQEQNQNQEQVQSVPTTVAYVDLVKKLRQMREQTEPTEPTEPTEQVQKETKQVAKSQKQSNTQTQNQTYSKPRLPRLSPEEYQKKLVGCQIVFMNELKIYLREEVKIKEKETNEVEKSGEAEKSKKSKTTDKPKSMKVQMTNLEQIQSGSRRINIIRVINSRVEPSKMVYFENLLKNRQMNFVEHLSEFMDRYNVRTTYKSLNTILLHSPYIMV